MKKFIYLIVCIFLLTGCTAEYNLNIEEERFSESIDILFLKEESPISQLNTIVKQKTPITVDTNETQFYNTNITSNEFYNIINYSFNQNENTILNSYFIKKCYSGNSISINDDKIVISTEKLFQCIVMDDSAGLEKATINITTKLKVKSHNADVVSGDTYTWNIDSINYTNKPIQMEIKLPTTTEDVVETIENSSLNFELIVIYGTVILVLLLVIIYVLYKKKKNNSL